MSAIRASASKHTRTLSQPLRRSFYTPFAALQHSPLLAKKPTATSSGNDAAAAVAAHEHEREHAARTLHVVSEPNAADFKYGVPAGAYPNAAPYHHNMAQVTLENVSPSSTSSAGAHPVLTRAALRDTVGIVSATGVSGEGLEGEEALRVIRHLYKRMERRWGDLVLKKHGSVEGE